MYLIENKSNLLLLNNKLVAPFGFKIIETTSVHAILELIPKELKNVRLAFKLYTTNHSTMSIKRKTCIINNKDLLDVLRNPIYKPFIEEATWQLTQEKLKPTIKLFT